MQTQHVLMIVNVNGHNGQEMADWWGKWKWQMTRQIDEKIPMLID
jgi:hypothetical protein